MQVEDLCEKASPKLYALIRVKPYMSPSKKPQNEYRRMLSLDHNSVIVQLYGHSNIFNDVINRFHESVHV